jgi:acyl-CoA dehydrogenase
MSESMHDELRDLAESVFGAAWNNGADGFDAELWQTLEQTGLARLTLPESAGGSGGSLVDAAVVFTAAGRFAARVPLAETDLACWLLNGAGLEVPAGPLTAISTQDLVLASTPEGIEASGTLRRVPWARSVGHLVVLAGQRVVLIDREHTQVTFGLNLAEEPRDDVIVDDVVVAMSTVSAEFAAEYPLRAALARTLLLAGAIRGVVEMAVTYAADRVQFGKPIARLQVIQQSLAVAAAEAAAATTVARAAAQEAGERGFGTAGLAIAAAKVRCDEAAGGVARIAHQVHGAIGFTREHDLRILTTRLWAWRDEAGAEPQWLEQLGARALDAGSDGIWALLSDTQL